jgi:hypothetical protein
MSGRISLLAACAVLAALMAMPSLADPAVTVSVHSSLAGEVVQPEYDYIDWKITFSASTGDNDGVALILVDFVQSELNPGRFAIPIATAVPDGMQGFADPNGFSNVGPGGYLGTPLGTDCYANLYQIGGAQNTFGVAGTSMGQDIDVDPNVGLDPNAQTLASGEFEAPSERGLYIFYVANAVANVLDPNSVSSPPDPSPVSEAGIIYAGASFVIIVCPGDVNGDGEVDMEDLGQLLAAFDKCEEDEGYDPEADLNNDGCVDILDLGVLLPNLDTVCNE